MSRVGNKISELDVDSQALAAKRRESGLAGINYTDPISPYQLEAPRYPGPYPEFFGILFRTKESLSKSINIYKTYVMVSMRQKIFHSTMLFLRP